MVTDFQYVARNLDAEADVLEGYSAAFASIGQQGTAQRLTLSACRLRELAQWTRDKIGEQVNQILLDDKAQHEGMINALTDVIKARGIQ